MTPSFNYEFLVLLWAAAMEALQQEKYPKHQVDRKKPCHGGQNPCALRCTSWEGFTSLYFVNFDRGHHREQKYSMVEHVR